MKKRRTHRNAEQALFSVNLCALCGSVVKLIYHEETKNTQERGASFVLCESLCTLWLCGKLIHHGKTENT